MQIVRIYPHFVKVCGVALFNFASSPTLVKTDDDEEEVKLRSLRDWKEIPNLQILNLMYDVTPAEYIRMVICEYGSVPPSSVPVVHRLVNEGM